MDSTVEGKTETTPSDLDLVDVTRMPLHDLVFSEGDVLANSLLRLLAELDSQREITASFGNRAG